MLLSDDSLMPRGKFKGTKMIDVPRKYLLYYLYEVIGTNRTHGEVRDIQIYINSNIERIRG